MTATCTPAPASSSKAAAVSASNCVTPSSGPSVRSTISAAWRARSTAAAKRSGEESSSSMRTRSVKDTRCGDR